PKLESLVKSLARKLLSMGVQGEGEGGADETEVREAIESTVKQLEDAERRAIIKAKKGWEDGREVERADEVERTRQVKQNFALTRALT
ncbi:MAG: hypothetical protein SGPRY_004687, partial [Prymnesium sp.]